MRSIADPRVLDRLVARLGALSPATPRRWGTLSPQEMLCHLADASASVLSRSGGPPGPSRPVVKWLGLYTGFPWPRGLQTPARVDPRREGSRPAAFNEDRARAVAGLRALAAAPAGTLPGSHGYFGAMSHRDWLRWGFRHTDHHLRQFGL